MAQKTRATITAELDALLIDTAAEGSITPEVLKAKLIDIVDSALVPLTDTNQRGLYAYDTGLTYYNGAIVQYDYKWYVANTTTTPGAFNSSQWTFQGYIQYSGSLTIPTASVLTLNGTPLTLVAAIASKIIQVKNIRGRLTYNSINYATNTQIDVYMSVGGSPQVQFTLPTFLDSTANKVKVGTITANASVTTNQALMVRVNSGNPTAGNSDITIYFDYQVVD